MRDLTPAQSELDPIEIASRDEIAALQLERLKWSLRARLRQRARSTGPRSMPPASIPTTLTTLADLGKFPFTPRRTCATTIPSACSPCRARRSCASTPPPAPPASRPSSATPKSDIDMWAAWSPARSAPRAAGRAMMVHVAYGYGLFTGGLGAHYGAERLGCTVVPVSGGMTERQVQLIEDFRAGHHHGHALLHAGDPRRVPPQGLDPRATLARGRHLRRRALDQRHARRNRGRLRHARRRHLRPVGGDGPGRRQRVRRDQGRAAHLGGPFLPGDRSTR